MHTPESHRSFGIFVLPILFLFIGSCSVLFWKPVSQSVDARWAGQTRVYEVLLHFETRMSWNPWSQAAVNRNYRTEILLHVIQNGQIKESRSLITFDGWVSPESFMPYARGFIMQRGDSEILGGGKQEIYAVTIAPDYQSATGKTLINPEHTLIGSYVTPDGRTLALFSSDADVEEPGGMIYYSFYSLTETTTHRDPVLQSKGSFEFDGAPGLPELTWGNGLDRIYARLPAAVLEIEASTGEVREANRFPACFDMVRIPPFVSRRGFRFSRSEEGLAIIDEGNPLPSPFTFVPMIDEMAAISTDCKQYLGR
ncbi:MAG: hypothetical protein KDK37_16090 [Leptospiraceae bacterium]|nr:hypothetical protein [Leptospiraceae bacterium]MCB1305810.1 hypothetical protein [Leptospiraceae bacterium]